ncbi:MAG TPA: sensor histidine kinase [Bacteroidia bacterium]|nr:sensor histidine kinase [Bacteroidia bacterium]
MTKISFTVSARTARLIGRENVANAEGALIELVKNCYDADSKTTIILIDKANDTILIIDNGIGMTDKIISEQWMTIGTDDKLNNAITDSGRIKAGAKGIGRFALDRLGEECTMITFPKYNEVGYKWLVNWGDFEKIKDGNNIKINEVYAELNTLKNTTYKKEFLKEIKNEKVVELLINEVFHQGTLLKITGLRDEWNNDTVAKIYENLELLTPPDGANRINIFLINGDEPDKYGLVPNTDFSDYDYKVVATYKKNKENKITVKIHRNEFDLNLIDDRLFEYPDMKEFPFDKKTFKKEHFQLELTFDELIKGFEDKKGIVNTIGDFEFTYYFLKNISSSDDRERLKYKEFTGDRGFWLKKFGGIKLYRDNFRVRPYGEIGTPAYDWLMLGERYGLNPAGVARKGSRIRPNQVAGIVKFSRLSNFFLEDKSSREGLQENDTFELLKNILIAIIKIQEDDRSTIAYNLNELFKIINKEQQAMEDSDNIVDEDDETVDDETQEETKAKNKTVKKGYKALKAKLKEKEEELGISRAMASAGIMIASFSHEFHGIKNDLSSRTSELKKFLKSVIDYEKLKGVPDRKNPLKLIDDFQKQDDKIRQWIEFSVGLTKKDRRKNKKIDITDYFQNFNETWTKLFAQRDVDFSFNHEKGGNYKMKISELDLDTIFDNLMINSIEAFERNGFSGDKTISITIQNQKNNIWIKYTDSGPGIPITYKNINAIFTPFETSKKDDLGNDIGTGLGMWLVKSSVDSNKGKIELKRPKSGFELNIFFKFLK